MCSSYIAKKLEIDNTPSDEIKNNLTYNSAGATQVVIEKTLEKIKYAVRFNKE